MIKLISLLFLSLSFLLGCTTTENRALTIAALENNSGFGGTGIIQRLNDEENSGFGGTGIVGNIQAFGSIWVNGIEVEYAEDVLLDSNLAIQNERLKLGQQVILETDLELTADNLPKTNKISIFYPIAGRIDSVKKQQIKVQNQWVHYSNDTFMDNDLNISVGNYVIINANQVKDNQWLATRLNTNKQRLTHLQTQMVLNFSNHVKQVVIDPKLATMQWKQQADLFSQDNNGMIIGQWDHMQLEFINNSIQHRSMIRQPHSNMQRPTNIMQHIDTMRPTLRRTPSRNMIRTMPSR